MSDERWIVIPNWDGGDGHDGFQHYKDRDPTWIKNYRRLLHKPEYLELTAAQRGVLHGLWLEYAAAHRNVRLNTAQISRRLSLRVTKRTLDALNHAGFIEFSASKPLAPRYQTASPEKRREEKNPPTPLRGKPQNTNGRQEAPLMIDVVSACQNFIEGQGWDDSFTEPMVIEEFGRIERARRTTGTIGSPELAGLLEQWKAERQNRYGTPANLNAVPAE